jgi:hypothetical protein
MQYTKQIILSQKLLSSHIPWKKPCIVDVPVLLNLEENAEHWANVIEISDKCRVSNIFVKSNSKKPRCLLNRTMFCNVKMQIKIIVCVAWNNLFGSLEI